MADFQDEMQGGSLMSGYDLGKGEGNSQGMDDIHGDRRSRSPRRRSHSRSPRRMERRSRFDRDRETDRRPYMDRRDRDPRWMKRVIMCNIPYDIRWPEIKDLFKEKVGEAPYVEVFETPDGKSRGMALLEFKDSDIAEKAVDILNRYEMKGRSIIVRIPKEKDKREYEQMRARKTVPGPGPAMPGPPGRGGSMSMGSMGGGSYPPDDLQKLTGGRPLKNRIFVANLDYTVSESKVKEIFKLAGNVESIIMKKNKEGSFKGMCVVQFQHPLEAVQAISMFNEQTFYDRKLVVKMDEDPAANREERLPSKLPAGLRSIGAGLGSGGRILNVKDGGANSGFGGMNTMSGMGSSMGYGVSGSGGMSDMMGGRSMYGLGDSSSGLGGLGSLGGGGSGMMGSHSMLDSMGGNLGGSYSRLGGNMDRGSSRGGPMGGVSSSVLVSNLPFSVDWKQLKDRFRDAGDVVFAEIMSRGTGLVRFSSVDEARRSIMMLNGSRMAGREIEVSFDR